MKKDESDKLLKRFEEAFDEALKQGFLEQVGERNGEPTYVITPKGEAWNEAYKREKACREFIKELDF